MTQGTKIELETPKIATGLDHVARKKVEQEKQFNLSTNCHETCL